MQVLVEGKLKMMLKRQLIFYSQIFLRYFEKIIHKKKRVKTFLFEFLFKSIGLHANKIIKKGGEVFFALLDGRVVGTAAMVLTGL